MKYHEIKQYSGIGGNTHSKQTKHRSLVMYEAGTLMTFPIPDKHTIPHTYQCTTPNVGWAYIYTAIKNITVKNSTYRVTHPHRLIGCSAIVL